MPDWRSEVDKSLSGSGLDPADRCDLAEELTQHLEDRYRELLSGGEDEAAARRTVLGELGNMAGLRAPLARSRRTRTPQSDLGAPRSGNFGGFARDLRYGWRVMRRAPVFTLFAVLSLGLGIGANTTVFTIVNTLLLHPLPVDRPADLSALFETGRKGSKQAEAHLALPYADFEDYAKRQTSFRALAAFTPPVVMALRGAAGPERVFGEFVSKDYFGTLGIRPAIGRFFLPEEDTQPGSAPVAILSYNAWQLRFGGAPDVIGRLLVLNNVGFTVIGVAPERFLGVSAVFGPDVWLPATMAESAFPAEFAGAFSDRAKALFHGVGRLRPGSTREQAQADLETVAASLQKEYPSTNESRSISVRPIADELFSNMGGSGGLTFGSGILFAIVGLVLAIACANVANLLLARAVARRQEVAVRLAIGANRGRLVQQMLTESFLLSILSCVAGVGIGIAGCRFVWSFVPAEVAGNMISPRLDAGVLLFAFFASLFTGFLFGLAPALRASKTDVVSALKEETRIGGRVRRTARLMNALLVGQVAFSLVCLLTSVLFFRAIQRAWTIDPGFEFRHLGLWLVNPAQAGFGETRVKEFYREARERVAAMPGVASVSWSSGLPFWNTPGRSLVIQGVEQRAHSDAISTVTFTIDAGYFETVQIPLLRGRAVTENDREETAPVAVINEALAREHWPGGDALGHRFQFAGETVWRQVVGIVKNANYSSLGEHPQPCVYLPLGQNYSGDMILYVRADGDPANLLAAVQRELRNLNAAIVISDARTGTKLMEQVLWGPRVGVALLGVFGLLALTLASVGLYGVMAYSVSQRTREIGVRAALGASRPLLLRLVVGDGMRLVLYGVALGLGAAILAGRALSGMLFGLSTADPVSLALAGFTLISVALIACYLPARTAIRIDPAAALRDS